MPEGDRVTIELCIPCQKSRFCMRRNYSSCTSARVYGVNVRCTDPTLPLGAYGEYMYVAPGSRIHKIRAGVPPVSTYLSSLLGIGIQWARTRGQLRLGESVAIIGPVALGHLLSYQLICALRCHKMFCTTI